jgi:pilus assembly protein TadC
MSRQKKARVFSRTFKLAAVRRMMEAEKKAAGLPPKLTVPMILFFLSVLFIVILGPAGIRIAEMK